MEIYVKVLNRFTKRFTIKRLNVTINASPLTDNASDEDTYENAIPTMDAILKAIQRKNYPDCTLTRVYPLTRETVKDATIFEHKRIRDSKGNALQAFRTAYPRHYGADGFQMAVSCTVKSIFEINSTNAHEWYTTTPNAFGVVNANRKEPATGRQKPHAPAKYPPQGY